MEVLNGPVQELCRRVSIPSLLAVGAHKVADVATSPGNHSDDILVGGAFVQGKAVDWTNWVIL